MGRLPTSDASLLTGTRKEKGLPDLEIPAREARTSAL